MLLHEARGFLRFIQTLLDLIHAVGQRVVCQQIQARQNTVKGRNALFRLLELDATLLVVAFMTGNRPFQFATAGIEFANFRFRVGFEGHGQMAADKAAKRLMQTLGFLHVKRQRRKAFRQRFTLGVQAFDAAFARGAAKQRQFREAGVAPLTVGDFDHHRFFQLVDAEYAVIERLRIPFDQVEIFRAIFQTGKLLRNQRQIRHHDRVTRRAIQCREVRRIVQADIVVNLRQQHAAKTLCQGIEARVFRTARLA